LEAHFSPGEVYELWLNYPDPYPKRRHEKHRLTHPRFLRLYYHVLAPTGRLHLRTDDEALYQYSLEQLQTAGWKVVLATPDLLPQEGPEEAHFETEFRRRKGGTIHYIQAHHPLTTE
jgi:tRNA (guanine-N7-)-methyltransferase